MKKILLYLIMFIFLLDIVLAQDAFNLEVEIPETYEDILAGENIWFTTNLVNLASTKRVDVMLKYEIFDSDRNLKTMKSETLAIETQASFVGNVRAPRDLEEGLYFLKVSLNSTFGTSETETSFNVIKEETQKQVIIKFSLFDIQLTIPEDYKIVSPGDELLSSIKLVNLGKEGRIDIFLEYWVSDSEQNIILKKKESVAVETQASFVRTFDIPKEIKPGKYTLYTKIIYADGKEAVADHSFEVVKKKTDKKLYYGFTGLLGLIILIYIIYKSKPLVKRLQVQAKISRIIKKRKL